MTEKSYSVDRAYAELGGFGKFQLLATVLCTLSRLSGQLFTYLFAFFIAKQAYVCSSGPDSLMAPCSNEYICDELSRGNTIPYAADTSRERFFNNWFVEMDLICTAPAVIGALYTVERALEGAVGFAFPWIPDKLGRRRSMIYFLGLNLFAQTILVFIPWYTAKMFGMVLLAVGGSVKNSLSYTWIFECTHSDH